MNAKKLLLFVLLSQAFGVALAQHTVRVDPSQSEVHFTLPDPMHGIHGTFKVTGGEITFADHEGLMSGAVSVDARSGSSGNSSRDKKMTEDQLKASLFNTVTFAPTSYTGVLNGSGNSDITVNGVFTLLGKPHEISVPMHVERDGNTVKATGSFVVPYVKWGVKDPSNFLLKVGKEVTIQLTLAGTLEGQS